MIWFFFIYLHICINMYIYEQITTYNGSYFYPIWSMPQVGQYIRCISSLYDAILHICNQHHIYENTHFLICNSTSFVCRNAQFHTVRICDMHNISIHICTVDSYECIWFRIDFLDLCTNMFCSMKCILLMSASE